MGRSIKRRVASPPCHQNTAPRGRSLDSRVGGGEPTAKQKVFLPQVQNNSDSLLNTHSTVEDWRNLGEWGGGGRGGVKLNQPGRQKLGRYRSPVSRHSMQSYILTYCRLSRTSEPLIALGSHQGGSGEGPLISASAVPIVGGWGWGADLNTLALRRWYQTVVFTTRAVSRQAYFPSTPYPQGWGRGRGWGEWGNH